MSGAYKKSETDGDDHLKMIATATYYCVELNDSDFNPDDEIQDWVAAKVEIDNLLRISKSGYELLQRSKEVL